MYYLAYVKQAWKNYLREWNVSTLRWDCEDIEEAVIQRLQQLSCDLEHYVYLCNPDTFHEVYIYLETNDSEFQKDPHYTALVKVLDRCTNKITSFWIQENYRCMLAHATGVGTYACVEFRNLYITKTKWVNERWTISGTTAMKCLKKMKKNLPMQKKRKTIKWINNNIK